VLFRSPAYRGGLEAPQGATDGSPGGRFARRCSPSAVHWQKRFAGSRFRGEPDRGDAHSRRWRAVWSRDCPALWSRRLCLDRRGSRVIQRGTRKPSSVSSAKARFGRTENAGRGRVLRFTRSAVEASRNVAFLPGEGDIKRRPPGRVLDASLFIRPLPIPQVKTKTSLSLFPRKRRTGLSFLFRLPAPNI
jgi:hypothetical protein